MTRWGGVLALVACGAETPVSVAQVAPTVPTIRVTHTGGDHFHVEYTFPEPARSLTFVLPSPVVRTHWRAASDEMRLVRQGGVDTLIAAEPRRSWAIDIDVDDIRPEKDYRTFYRLTDRGLLLYTGHIAAVPTGAPPKEPMRLVLAAADGETVLVHGAPQGREALTVALPATYAYFGTLRPIETADFVGIVDRGYPPALRERLDELLPPLFALFGDSLGRPASAAEKPLLLATFQQLPADGRDLGGNVMPPRVVNFGFGLGSSTPEVESEIELIVAHEVAHLWNVDLYSVREQRNTDWLREGSAEALAYRALRRLGRLDDRAYRARLSNALSLCVLSLAEGEPLSASMRAGHSRDFYNCGSTIALLTEGALKSDLFAFYREVFAGPDGHYDAARFYDVLGARDRATADFVRRFAEDRLADPTTEILAALRRVGVETAMSTELPSAYEQQVGSFAVRALFSRACQVELRGNYGVVPRVVECGDAARGDLLESLAGVDVANRGASAFDAAYTECTTKRIIDVGRTGKPAVRVPCADAPRARVPYFNVVRMP